MTRKLPGKNIVGVFQNITQDLSFNQSIIEPSELILNSTQIQETTDSVFAVINDRPYSVYIYVSCIVVLSATIVGVLICLIKKKEIQNKRTLKFPLEGIKFEITPVKESTYSPQKVIAGVISKQNDISLDEAETIKEIEKIDKRIKQLQSK